MKPPTVEKTQSCRSYHETWPGETEGKTLNQMRVITAAAASERGHRISAWSLEFDDRSRFGFISTCKDCHSWIKIKNWKVAPEEALRIAQAGFLVAQDANAITNRDHVVAMGAALIMDCWERTDQNSTPSLLARN
jgi:hypothetical protein